jgi:hypothetical protein
MTFSEKLKSLLEKSVDSSKDFLAKAGSQAQTWGEMGKIKFEILQLRGKAQNLTTKLGAEVYNLLVEKNEPMIGSYTEGIADVLKQMKEIDREIDLKEEAYRKAGGKDSDLDEK